MNDEQDLQNLIASKDVRTQCVKENRVFSLREQATLLWNNPAIKNHSERCALLRQIQNRAKADSSLAALCRQIDERLETQAQLEHRFYSDEAKQYYQISYWENRSNKWERDDMLFSDLAKTHKYVVEELLEFCLDNKYTINKCYLDSHDQISAVFKTDSNRDSELLSIVAYGGTNLDPYDCFDGKRFEGAFILLPFPFRDGDFVRTIGSEEIGIFQSNCQDAEAYQRHAEFHKKLNAQGLIDYSDVSCRVEYLVPSYENPKQLSFSHGHTELINLEYATVDKSDPNYDIMMQAQALVRGESSLEAFCNVLLAARKVR